MPRLHLSACVLAGLLAGCHVNPAPSDLDGLTRWMWLNERTATEAELMEGIRKLDSAAGALDSARKETISKLQKGDATAAGASFEGDLSKASGMMLLNVIHCPLARVNELLVQKDQKALHANYITYDRSFDTSLDDYLSGRSPTLAWHSTYTLQLVSPIFRPQVPGESRLVPEVKSGNAPHGPAIYALAYFKGPAEVVNGGSDDFNQSYQIQAFYERKPGEVVHLYAMWVEMKIGFLGSDGPEVTSITLDSLEKSDKDYEDHCQK